MTVYRPRRRHPDLVERLADAGIGFAIGAGLAVLGWLATIWWVMR
jgi:hypothetical protein